MPNMATYATPRIDLGVALEEYNYDEAKLIGTQVLPIFGTSKKAGAFSKITRESLLRARDVKRAARSAYNRDTFNGEDQAFACEEFGTEQPLDDSERSLYASDFAAELIAAKVAKGVLLLEQEKRIASAIFNATTWSGAALFTDNKATPWSTVGTDIIGQVLAAIEKVRTNCGMRPNTLIMGAESFANVTKNTGIRAALQYTTLPTRDAILNALAGLFGLRKILIGDAVRNSANEGAAYSGADVWVKTYAMVGIVGMSGDLAEPCLGRTMLWTSDSPDNATIEEYREEQTRSTVYRARHHTDELVFDPYFGHLMQIEA